MKKWICDRDTQVVPPGNPPENIVGVRHGDAVFSEEAPNRHFHEEPLHVQNQKWIEKGQYIVERDLLM